MSYHFDSLREAAIQTVTQADVAVGVADTAFLGADTTRTAIILTAHPTIRYTVSLVAPAVLDRGITIPAGGANFVLRIEDFGPGVRQALRAIAALAATVSVITVTTPTS